MAKSSEGDRGPGRRVGRAAVGRRLISRLIPTLNSKRKLNFGGCFPATPSRERGSLHPVNVYNQTIEARCDRIRIPVWGAWGDAFPHILFLFSRIVSISVQSPARVESSQAQRKPIRIWRLPDLRACRAAARQIPPSSSQEQPFRMCRPGRCSDAVH